MNQIILDHVTKKYEGRYVLKTVDHIFHKGESVALIGRNGCGKSTLLRLIAGLVAPSSGNVRYEEPLHFAYVPEKFTPLKLTARSFLVRMGEIEGMKRKELEEAINSLGEDFFLSEMLDLPMHSLSKGTLQKISVIQALLKRPDVLLLDEPLSGQDRESQKVFVRKINRLRDSGTTVFMSCHEKQLVKAVSEQVYTICDGEFCRFEEKREHDFVLFWENRQNKNVIPGMERYGSRYKLTVREPAVQKTIMQLLGEGWELKEMYENDTQTDNFSDTDIF